MAFTNPGFEDASATTLGLPDAWENIAFVTNGWRVATYATAVSGKLEDPFEGLEEGWGSNEDSLLAFGGGDTEIAIFDVSVGPEGVEDFEEGWSTSPYATTFTPAEDASFDGLAFIEAANPEPYSLEAGDTLSLTTDVGGPASSDAFTGTQALFDGTPTVPTGFEGTNRFRLTVDGFLPIVIELGTVSTLADIVGIINAQAPAPVATDEGFGQMFITSPTIGSDSRIVLEEIQSARSVATNPAPYALADGDDLDVEIDGGASQNIVFAAGDFPDIANATAFEVASVINDQLTDATADAFFGLVRIISDTVEGSRVQVTGGTAAAKIGFPAAEKKSPLQILDVGPGTDTGTGNVGDLQAVTAREIADVVNGSAAIQAIDAELRSDPLRAYSETPEVGTIQVNASGVQTAADFTPTSATGTGATAEIVEDFAEGWGLGADPYAVFDFAIGSTNTADFDTAADDTEDFEEEWSNTPFAFDVGDITIDAAEYNDDPLSVALFREDFESVAFDVTFSVDTATDRLTTNAAHGLSTDVSPATVYSTGILPAELAPGRDYWPTVVDAVTLTLKNVAGGAVVDITDAGNGTHYLKRPRTAFWTEDLGI